MESREKAPLVKDYYEQIVNVHRDYYEFWIDNTFLHWDWWLSLVLTIVPWIVWWKLCKKESLTRMLLIALIITLISCWLDFLGTVRGYWYYSGKLIPTIPSFAPWDFSLLPVCMTILIQYRPLVPIWKKALLFATLTAFVGEPLFHVIGLYNPIKWEYYYSFPIYILFFYFAHYLTIKFRGFAPIVK